LITLSEVEGGNDKVSVSFFITPDTKLPKPNDNSIRVETRAGCTVYVRIFHDSSRAAAYSNVKQLREELELAGKVFAPHTYTGAGYQNPWDIFHHHNEIWIQAA